MVASNPKRTSIVDLHLVGMKTKYIAKTLCVPPRTVRRTVNLFKTTGGTADRRRPGRPPTAVSKANVTKIRKRIECRPKLSMRKMARDLGISDFPVRKIVHEKLNIKSYKIYRTAGLTSANMAKRVARCKELLKRAARNRHRNFVFSDEKIFTVEAVVNRQNDRILAKHREAANSVGGIVSRASKPANVMVFACITSDGKSPLVFVDSGVKINQHNYLNDVLIKVVEPWLKSHFGTDPYVFQQNGAPSHTARTVQEWCENNLCDFTRSDEWPPNSPDLNPMDYSVWSVSESKACTSPHSSVNSLKAALVKAWDEIDEEYLRRTVDAFPRRLRQCIGARGGRIEQK